MAIDYFFFRKMSKKISRRINYFTITNKKVVEEVFKQFENPYYGMLSKLHADTSIPFSTLSDWKRQYDKDPKWRPYIGINKSSHQRIFTNDEETNIRTFPKRLVNK